jgi:hypothetical protein
MMYRHKSFEILVSNWSTLIFGTATSNEPTTLAPDDASARSFEGMIIGRGKRKALRKAIPQCHFVHHKSNMDGLGFQGKKPPTDLMT